MVGETPTTKEDCPVGAKPKAINSKFGWLLPPAGRGEAEGKTPTRQVEYCKMIRKIDTAKHRRIITVVILLCFVAFAKTNAQPFSKLYFDGRPAMLFSSIEATDSSYFVTGVSNQKNTPFYRRAVIGSINHNGAIDSLYYLFDSLPESYEIFGNSLKKVGSHYIAAGSVVDSVSRAFIIRFDSAFNILFYHTYSDTISEIFQGFDVEEVKEGGYLLAINRSFNTNNDVMVIRTDSLGAVINKQIYQAGLLEYPWVIRPMLNGHYMVGAFSRKATTYTPFWCKTWLIEVDSMGNMVRQWLDSDPKNRLPKSMQQTADSGWIIVRQHLAYDVSNAQGYNGSLVKLDKHFNKEWEVVRGDNNFDAGFYDIEILPDEKYILCGSTPTWGHDSAYQWGWILKVDTGGTVLWDKKYVAYERFGTYNYLYDIDVLPNGDLLACGELYFTMNVGISPIQQGWILRTDSNGCVIDNCLTGINDKPHTTDHRGIQMQVYPNPFTDDLSIALMDDIHEAAFTITDVNGKVVYRKQETNLAKGYTKVLDLSWLASGVYFVNVESDGQCVSKRVVKE